MRKTLTLLIFAFISVNVFADNGSVIVSNEFPNDGVMLENHVYKNSATFRNLGIYDGTINAVAIYENISCEPGYYLPENVENCTKCAENHYCIGGTAGMESCPDGLVAPIGTKSAELCGKKIYFGEDYIYLTSVKQTSPAMAVQIGDKTYYAKASPVESDGKKKMNIDAAHSLEMLFNEIEYSIYDNTIE